MTITQKLQLFEDGILTNVEAARTALTNAMAEGKTANQVAKDIGMMEAIQLTSGMVLALKGESTGTEEQWGSVARLLEAKQSEVSSALSEGIMNGAAQTHLATLLGTKETVELLLESHRSISNA